MQSVEQVARSAIHIVATHVKQDAMAASAGAASGTTGHAAASIGGGPASGQSVVQSKNPIALQVQDVSHPASPGPPLLPPPHPSPGVQAAPCVQLPGGCGGGPQRTAHW